MINKSGSGIDQLSNLYSRVKKTEETTIRSLDLNDNSSLSFLAGDNLVFAIYHLHNGNIASAKNYLYKSAYIDKMLIDRGYSRPEYTLYSLLKATLADNLSLIDEYLLGISPNDITTVGHHLFNGVKGILAENQTLVLDSIAGIESTTKSTNQSYKEFGTVFKGLLEQDTDLIETRLKKLLKSHKKRAESQLVADYFCIDVTTMFKLAHRRGIVVELEDKLIPSAIVFSTAPVEFEGYAFFTPM